MKSKINKGGIKKLLEQAEKDGIQKIVVRAVVKIDGKFLFLERAPSEFLPGLLVFPGGAVNERENLLCALAREVKEETNLVVNNIGAYLGSFDCASSLGKKMRQFIFFVETKPGDIKLDRSEHSNYYLLNLSDEKFSKLNISNDTKIILSTVEKNK